MLIACCRVGAGLQEVFEGYSEGRKAVKFGPTNEMEFREGGPCFPFTTELAGKQYCFDGKGAIYLKHGTDSSLLHFPVSVGMCSWCPLEKMLASWNERISGKYEEQGK